MDNRSLFINEAILTGESASVSKKEGDESFMGTVVAAGQGRLLVEITGSNTQMGKIAESVQEKEEVTPLRKQLTS